MTLAPGGFAWLLRHELRLAVRGTGLKVRWYARIGPIVLLALVPTVGGVILAVVVALAARHADARATARALGEIHHLLGPIGAGVVALLVLMISTAAVAALRTFYDRGDLDLLLSAPVHPSRVLAAKSVGVALSVAAPFAVIFGPFLLTFAAFGYPRALGPLAMIAVDATLATAIAVGGIAALVSRIGARTARLAVQLGAAVIGGLVFLLSQAQNFAPELAHHLFHAVSKPWPAPFDWPARAATGEALPLAAMVGLAAVAAWSAARAGGARLIAVSDGDTPAVRTRSGPVRFRSGLTRIVVTKELRLIARDPELITQIALRLVYVVPLGGLLLRGKNGVDPGPAIAAAATGFAGLLASSLAWLAVAAEDAPDLLAAAPHRAATIARAKLIAACLVPVAVVVVAALGALPASVLAAAATLVLGTVAAVSAALVQAWFGRPAPRSAFRRRQAGSFVVAVGEVVMAGAWAGTASLLARGSLWAVAPALLASAIMAGAVEARKTGTAGTN